MVPPGTQPGTVIGCPQCQTQLTVPADVAPAPVAGATVVTAGPVGAQTTTTVINNNQTQDATNAMIMFLVGFCCCFTWPLGVCMYCSSKDPAAKPWVIANAVMTVLSIIVLVVVIILLASTASVAVNAFYTWSDAASTASSAWDTNTWDTTTWFG